MGGLSAANKWAVRWSPGKCQTTSWAALLAAHSDKAMKPSPVHAYLGGIQQSEPPQPSAWGLRDAETSPPPHPPQSTDPTAVGLGTQGRTQHTNTPWGQLGGVPTSHRRHCRKGFPRDHQKVPPLQHHGAHSEQPRSAGPPLWSTDTPRKDSPRRPHSARPDLGMLRRFTTPHRKPEEEEEEEEEGEGRRGGGLAALRGTHRAGRAAVGPPPLLRGSASSRGSPSPSRSRSPSPSRSGSRSGSWACSGTVSGT